MKKILSIILIITFVFILVSCGSKNEKAPTNETTTIEEAFSTPRFEKGLEYDYDDLSDFITLPAHTGLTLDVALTEVTDEDVENILRQSLTQAGETKELSTPAQEGNLIEYVSTATRDDTGDMLEQGASRNLIIGDGMFLEGFTENFIGAKKGDTLNFKYTFPTTYPQEELAGVSATYSCVINSISEVTLPEFTDEWVAAQGYDDVKTTADYCEFLRIGLEETAKENNAQTLRAAVQKVLEDGAIIVKYPQKEYKHYIDISEKTAQTNATVNGISLDQYIVQTYGGQTAFEEYQRSYAESKVKNDLIVYSIARETGVEVDKTEYTEQMEYGYEHYAASYGLNNKSDFEDAFGVDVTQAILYSSALDKLVETCKY